jgi:cell division septum initiation protein DivIVA
MSHFQRSGDTLEEQEGTTRSSGSRLAEFGDRLARAFTNHDRDPGDRLGPEPGEDLEYELLGDDPQEGTSARFPVGPFGYSRAAVDHYLAELERELAELRSQGPGPVSITEEIERLGEQTASILVVAHDQAHETTRHAEEQALQTTRRAQEQAQEATRRAQEQADRCVADAASNAVAITAQAKQQLRELDNETDSVWQERRRLLEDARVTGTALITLAEEAIERFPEDDKPATAGFDALREPPAAGPEAPFEPPVAGPEAPVEPRAHAPHPLIDTLQDPPDYGD